MAIPVAGARVLLTGASAGIGWEAAGRLAAAGATLAITGRRVDRLDARLETLAGDGHVALPADLGELAAAEALVDAAADAIGPLDVLVHNAGAPMRRPIDALTPAEVADTMRVNFEAPVRMALRALPGMRARRRGSQVFVSSLGGRLGIIHEAAYCASKFALCGWAEAMAIDLWDEPVDVRLVIPGPIDTEIWDRPGNDAPIYDGPKEPPSVVADAIVAAIEGDAFEIYAPDLKGVVEWKTTDADGFLAGAAAMGSAS